MSWREQAAEKLDRESRSGTYGRHAAAMKGAVKDALTEFCRQDEEFAQAVVQGGTFADCMKAVEKGVGQSISDLAAYRRAVKFFFEGATVEFQMKITLAAAEPEAHGIVLNFEDFL